MEYVNNIKLQVDAKLENVSVVRVAVTAFFSILEISIDDLMDIKTAVSEAVTNCIEHGYENIEGSIFVSAKIDSNDYNVVTITIQDYGVGIENIELAMTPAYTSKPELEHAGMGFTIMEAFMDQVIINSTLDEGTIVTLVKKLKKKKSVDSQKQIQYSY